MNVKRLYLPVLHSCGSPLFCSCKSMISSGFPKGGSSSPYWVMFGSCIRLVLFVSLSRKFGLSVLLYVVPLLPSGSVELLQHCISESQAIASCSNTIDTAKITTSACLWWFPAKCPFLVKCRVLSFASFPEQ